ncbi:ABC transporter permease [Shewanella marina]|uniref:ABC transporter permease n=1 Tax=Shewanella marina TaxID=487319 RepID=UPI0004724408|nr:ABC transporter permease [Shewanella marina]
MHNFFHLMVESYRSAFVSLSSQGLRSALTTLGIIIGVAAVIVVIGVMNALASNVTKQFDDLGSNMVSLRADTRLDEALLGVENRLKYADYQLLKSRMTNIEVMAPVMSPMSSFLEVQYGQHVSRTHIKATNAQYQQVVQLYPQYGRFINHSDDIRRRRVAVLGVSVVEQLKLPQNPVGHYLMLAGDWFKIIGVAEAKGSLFGIDQDNYIITPFSTFRSIYNDYATENIEVLFIPHNINQTDDIIDNMRDILRNKYKLSSQESDFFKFETADKLKQQFNQIFDSVTIVASAVVGISLLVGGIGVMNIMLMTVTERTREIGIRKALGATPNTIKLQFLIEAVLLSFFGGVIGLFLGVSLTAFILLFIPGNAAFSIPFWAMILSLSFTAVIGIVFGLVPAIKAANLDPVDALRYE